MATLRRTAQVALSVRVFARFNGISESTAWKLVRSGQVESYRAGNQVRISPEAAEAFRDPRNEFDAMIKRIVGRATVLTPAQTAELATLFADDDDLKDDDEPLVRPTIRRQRRRNTRRSA